MARKSKKSETIAALFETCRRRGDWEFDNDLVKKICQKTGFGNPFDVTKLDSTEKFPLVLLENDYFITHLGKGRHRFVKGIDNGYHRFETIAPENCEQVTYRPSILNEFDTSESNILSLAFNQRIIQKFLYDDISCSPRIYMARRTQANLAYTIGGQKIQANRLQMEIDLTCEYNSEVITFEGKNGFAKDFAIYQIYHPFLYYHRLKEENSLDIKNIHSCYLIRASRASETIVRIYQYAFDDPWDMASIELERSAEFRLVQRTGHAR